MNDFQSWLSTLTPAQRNAVEQATKLITDMLLSLEQRMSVLESRADAQDRLIADQEQRISALERALDQEVAIDFTSALQKLTF